jgi:hypothetical protein
MSVINQILISIIILFGFFGQAVFGFGGGLVTIPLISLLMGVKETVTLVSIFQLMMGLLIFKTHKTTNWQVGIPVTAGMLIGVPLGIYSLTSFSDTFLRRFLALFMLAFLVRAQFFPGWRLGANRGKGWALSVGGIFGWLQGLLGSGGPVIVLYLMEVLPDKTSFRSTVIYAAFTSNLIRFGLSISTGLITPELVKIALPIMPLFLIAVYFGQRSFARLDERYYQIGVKLILFASAISLLLKS